MSLNPNLIITDYFDSLIRHIDIYIEEQLLRVDSGEFISANDSDYGRIFPIKKKNTLAENIDHVIDYEAIEDVYKYGQDKVFSWGCFEMPSFEFERSESQTLINMTDYLNKARNVILAELEEIQKKTFDDYKTIKGELKRDNSSCVMSLVFEKRYAFILSFENFNFEDLFISQVMHVIELDFFLYSHEWPLLM